MYFYVQCVRLIYRAEARLTVSLFCGSCKEMIRRMVSLGRQAVVMSREARGPCMATAPSVCA